MTSWTGSSARWSSWSGRRRLTASPTLRAIELAPRHSSAKCAICDKKRAPRARQPRATPKATLTQRILARARVCVVGNVSSRGCIAQPSGTARRDRSATGATRASPKPPWVEAPRWRGAGSRWERPVANLVTAVARTISLWSAAATVDTRGVPVPLALQPWSVR